MSSSDVAVIKSCGYSPPDPITSSGSNLMVQMTSDTTLTGFGFSATYEFVM